MVIASYDRMQMMRSVAVSENVYVSAQSSNMGVTFGKSESLILPATQWIL